MVTNSEKICHILGQSGFWLNPETFVLQYIQSACKSTRQNYVHLFSMRQAHSLKSMVSQGKATYTQVCLRMMPQLLPSLDLVVKEIVRLYEKPWAEHIAFSYSSDMHFQTFFVLLNTMPTHIWLVFYIWQHVYIWKLLFIDNRMIWKKKKNYTRLYERTLKKSMM